MGEQQYPTIESTVGSTPLVRLQRLAEDAAPGTVVLAKLEGNNPAGSVKDRPALSMIARAEERGDIRPGDTLIEATSGNTGIALAMAAAIKGYRLVLVMPEDLSVERARTMRAYGAELVLTARERGMEHSRDVAAAMVAAGEGIVLDQFANPDNPAAHEASTGPELWQQTSGHLTHPVSSMGTTGTITGTGRFLKKQSGDVRIVGRPAGGRRPHPRHPGLAAGVPPPRLRPERRRRAPVRQPDRRRGHHAGARPPRGHLRRCLVRWCGSSRAPPRPRDAGRDDRLHRRRPRRPLPVHRSVPRLTGLGGRTDPDDDRRDQVVDAWIHEGCG